MATEHRICLDSIAYVPIPNFHVSYPASCEGIFSSLKTGDISFLLIKSIYELPIARNGGPSSTKGPIIDRLELEEFG